MNKEQAVPKKSNSKSKDAVDKEDLIQLLDINNDTILQNIKQRFTKDQIYTNVGSTAILSINPFKSIDSSSDETYLAYHNNRLDNSPGKPELPAHVFTLINNCYSHMLFNSQDHSIILNGESGSGKSETAQLIIRYLCQISSKDKKSRKAFNNQSLEILAKDTKLSKGIKLVHTVLSSFMNTETNTSKSASRAGKWTEMQFNQKGKLVGMKLLDYLLEKPRVTTCNQDSFNYDIFYMILAGANQSEKQEFDILDLNSFNILGKQRANLSSMYQSKFHKLMDGMKSIGIGKRQQHEIFKLLAAILHLGNIDFEDERESHNDPASILHYDQLERAAQLLGVEAANLEVTLTYRTKFIKNELYTIFLDAKSARKQRDHFSSTIYALIVRWIVEHVNNRFCQDTCATFIGIFDFPGFQDDSLNGLYNLLYNYSTEKMINFATNFYFKQSSTDYDASGLEDVRRLTFKDNQTLLNIIESRSDYSIFSLIDSESLKSSNDRKTEDKIAQEILSRFEETGAIATIKKRSTLFSIKHTLGSVDYTTDKFKFRNTDVMSTDFVNLARGDNKECPPSENMYFQELFSDKLVLLEKYAKTGSDFLNVQGLSTPTRKPSMKRKTKIHEDDPLSLFDQATLTRNFQGSLEELLDTITCTKPWFVFCIKPNDNDIPNNFEEGKINVQLQGFKISEIASERKKNDFTISLEFDSFYQRFRKIIDILSIPESNIRKICVEFIHQTEWTDLDIKMDDRKIHLSEFAFTSLNDEIQLMNFEAEATRKQIAMEETQSINSESSHYESDVDSVFLYDQPVVTPTEKLTISDDIVKDGLIPMHKLPKTEKLPKAKSPKKSLARKKWLCFTWSLTFCIPSFCLKLCGMKRKDIQIAWREKIALCFIVAFLCASLLFFIIGLGIVVCPKVYIYSIPELSSRIKPSNAYAVAYGKVFDMANQVTSHLNSYSVQTYTMLPNMGGQDNSDMFFKVPLWNTYCPGIISPAQDFDNLMNRRSASTYNGVYYHNSTLSSGLNKRYIDYMYSFQVGNVGWDADQVQKQATTTKRLVILNRNVYDVSAYAGSSVDFFPEIKGVLSIWGGDITSQFNKALPIIERRNQVTACMNQMFFVGVIDSRNSFRCQISNYILVGSSVVILLVIGVKFIAAMHFGSTDDPEDNDKFVILQVPCYTEGSEALTKCLECLSMTKYDDKRKLLFVICDGMIIGSGNDRPTPRIVLDILGVDPSYEPKSKIFLSLGDGDKQHNVAKVYAGLYDIKGHAVPFIVVVKVGKASEKQRPGNRGKRDSQMILMKFLSKVHFNSEMNELELEIYHQMKNIIGVNPSYYEYILMVDSDTEVMPDSLNRLVSFMIHDSQVMGLCGETLLSNEKESMITMIQVYEYFISHNLSKKFESLFGTVTCLPGCFSMYRIRTPMDNIPLLISPAIIQDYSENTVDTLHTKNLLHLGEDRYLTTLMLKHFPNNKLSFTPDAVCRTNAPENWSVFKSQRRRWINSTVHNLYELVGLPGMCGICCLSMRSIVYLELFSTLVQPVTLLYLIYLVVILIITPSDANSYTFPLISVIILSIIYGLQVIIFLIKKQWGMIIWMLIYLLATPIFSFYLPLYSFWHFDDFSWGNTRVVVGEDGKKTAHAAECTPFDPSVIKLCKWNDTMITSNYNEQINQQLEKSERKNSSIFTASRNSMKSGVGVDHLQHLLPSDDRIFAEVKKMLTGADLMTITKKQVRDELSISLRQI